ncbi:iron-sulfur cluster-binding domain-containing protein [Streptomyces sp. FIT100]|nr:iron-sulfur cluster-binding domain-containing protein [Streptomyces sp. FIT100]
MVRAVHAAGTAEWRMVYCGRERATMPYADEARKLGAEITPGRPDFGFLAGVPAGAVVYCCGPQGLMDAVAEALPEGRELRVERFTAAAAAPGGAFEVELRRSGRTVTVPADRSVLAAVREELPNVPYSCRQGFCGTCQQRVLEGEIDHRDELLTDAERDGSMLICVSRCRGERLVLDL